MKGTREPRPGVLPGRADEAWSALSAAMEDHDPACADDTRFTADTLDADDERAVVAVCAGCPLLTECDAFAAALQPQAGVWAGRRWEPANRPRYTGRVAAGRLAGV